MADQTDGHLRVTLTGSLPVNLANYPEEVTTLEQARELEQGLIDNGDVSEEDVLSMLDSLETRFEVET